MITALRRELHAETLPLIIGELAADYDAKHGMGDRPARLNAAYHELAKELPFCRVASAKDLALKPDGLHFNAQSCRIFGRRYFEKLLEI